MRKLLSVVWVIAMAACGGDDPEPAPSCQQAVVHYYEAGCRLYTTTGQEYAGAEVVENCKQLLASSPSDACDGALEDLRRCFGGVPSPASNNADCDCSAEQDALFTCD